jgi:hypothetical protein
VTQKMCFSSFFFFFLFSCLFPAFGFCNLFFFLLLLLLFDYFTIYKWI